MKSGYRGEVGRERTLRRAGVAFAVALALIGVLAVIGRPYAQPRDRSLASALPAAHAEPAAPLRETRVVTSTALAAPDPSND